MQKYALSLFAILLLGILNLNAQEILPTKKETRKAQKAAQKAQQQRFLVIGANGRYGLTQDFRLSELTYQGIGPGLIYAYRIRSPKAWEDWTFDPSITFQSPAHGESQLLNGYLGFSYRYLHHVRDLGSAQDWKFYLGGETDSRANVKFNSSLGNSVATWEGIAALNLAAAVQKDLQICKRPLSLDYQLRLPVLAYVNRGPAYSLSGLDPRSHTFTSIWGLNRVDSEVGINFALAPNNPNRLRIAYRWDFYAFNDNGIHPVRSAQHGLLVELMVNLSAQR
jgi:hypothetical protein